jgi:hypothetical protein
MAHQGIAFGITAHIVKLVKRRLDNTGTIGERLGKSDLENQILSLRLPNHGNTAYHHYLALYEVEACIRAPKGMMT